MRPDGTWRKARRVKDGYVPQEEVPLYESKGKLFARKPTIPVGMCPVVAAAAKEAAAKRNAVINPLQHIPGLAASSSSSNPSSSKASKTSKPKKEPQQPATGKTAASKNKSKQAQASAAPTPLLTNQMDQLSLDESDPDKLAKHLKKLRKKLREIDNIEQKIKSGEIKTPDKDQVDKVARKALIRKEVERLEKHPVLLQHAESQQTAASTTSPT